MADGKVTIDTELNNKGLDKGLKDSGSKLKDFAKTAGKAGVTAAAAAVSIKAIAAGVKDLTDAYKTQIKAETQLESAAKNNPYLDSSSVQALKDYASELNSITVYGDEELIPFMAQLAASGRTQVEIMEIMSAATDMAASGQFSLDSAVRNLNKAYGGLSGELGEAIPEIKALTAEQLKNGGATKLLGERYKGIAKDVAAATGSAEKLASAMGDLKEELGASFEKALAPGRKATAEFTNELTNGLRVFREWQEATKKRETGKQDASSIQKEIDFLEKQKEAAEKTLEQIENASKFQLFFMGGEKGREKAKEQQEKIIDNLQEQIDLYEEERDVKAEIEDENNKLIQQETELAEKEQNKKSEMKKHRNISTV